MTYPELLLKFARLFPGVKVIPALYPVDEVRICIGCGGSTILVDGHNMPWHRSCHSIAVMNGKPTTSSTP